MRTTTSMISFVNAGEKTEEELLPKAYGNILRMRLGEILPQELTQRFAEIPVVFCRDAAVALLKTTAPRKYSWGAVVYKSTTVTS